MARIRARRAVGSTTVNISGRFGAADMGRLEHACAEALTRHPLQLQLDLTQVTAMDDTASAVVERLQRRGARIRNVPGDPEPGESSHSPGVRLRR